ncbi:MAG: Phosphoglycerate kinase [Candidatus Doudnabacteria bacterium]|nr:Phosphoglycerate kinase [Candidatus Doudnabacteria bacterium]
MRFISANKNLAGKTVLLRADLDAPTQDGKVLDDFRIRAALPTINYLQDQGAKIIILSKNGHKIDESLKPVAETLANLMQKKMVVAQDKMPNYDLHHIVFVPDDIRQEKTIQLVKSSSAKDIVILENVRFYPEEKNADPDFAKHLASLADIYVNDAFAMMHRNEASVSVVANYLPAYAGLNVEKELNGLNTILNLKTSPFVVLMGGAKITDKVGAIKNLGKKADNILMGGGPANLFFLAKGYEIGKSICEQDQKTLAEDLLRNFKDKIILPVDVVVANPTDFSGLRVCAPDQIKPNEAVFDIGPKTILKFAKYIKTAKKLAWNGPMGYFERNEFSHGTKAMALIYSSRCKGQAYGMVGGGDTLEAIDQAKVAEHIDFISTAGSATLEYLAGNQLPGLQALEANSKS